MKRGERDVPDCPCGPGRAAIVSALIPAGGARPAPVPHRPRFQAQRGQTMLHSQHNTHLGETPALPCLSPRPARAAPRLPPVLAPGGVW